MKAFHPMLVLVAGLGVVALSGCATSSAKRPAAVQAEPVLVPGFDEAGGDMLSDDLSDSTGPGTGNPAALAHYAAGISYEWNDEDEKAVQQFDEAALADPSNEHLVIKVAQHFLKNKQPDKAVAVLAKSARRPDASALLLSWLARAQLQAGKIGPALAASRKSIQRQPDAFDGYESQIEICFRGNRLSEAARTLNRAAKSVRPDPPSLVALAGLYAIYIKAQPKDTVTKSNAILLLDRVAKMDFASTRLWQTLGDTCVQMNQPKKAADIYLRLLDKAPESSGLRESLHEKLAGIYFQLEDKTNAVKQLEAIVRDNPVRYPRAWFFLGELAYDDDKLAEAAEDYGNAIHWDPGIEEAYYKLALVQIAMHHTEDAFKTLDEARTRFPKTFLGEYYTGVACLDVKDYRESVHHFNAAEVIASATDSSQLDARFYFQFGAAYERNQQFKQADEYLQKAINLSPAFGEALNYLGYMLADRGEQLPRAHDLIEKAVQLEPKNAAYLDSLGWVLFKQKQPQQALPWLLKAVEFSPEPDATVYDHLGEVYMALHQSAKAIDAWKKSLSIDSDPEEHDSVKKKLDLYSGSNQS